MKFYSNEKKFKFRFVLHSTNKTEALSLDHGWTAVSITSCDSQHTRTPTAAVVGVRVLTLTWRNGK